MFTQTIPLPGEPRVDGEPFVDGAGDIGEGVGAEADEAGEFEVDPVGGDDARAAGALPIVTSGVILPIVAAETPVFDKSLTEEYGRPETIFFAVAAPTPGKLSNSCSVALFRSTFGIVVLDWFADPELAGA